MVTKSITCTPFGVKYIYSVQGEQVWSEYLPGIRQREKLRSEHPEAPLHASLARTFQRIARFVL